jgi:hypothetical protein
MAWLAEIGKDFESLHVSKDGLRLNIDYVCSGSKDTITVSPNRYIVVNHESNDTPYLVTMDKSEMLRGYRLAKKCTCCGKYENEHAINYDDRVLMDPNDYNEGNIRSIMETSGVCYSCAFWMEKLSLHDDRTFIIAGTRWHDGGLLDKSKIPNGFAPVGCGGRVQYIETFDGRTIRTNNLWCQGDVPEHFKTEGSVLKDNAVFISEVRYLYLNDVVCQTQKQKFGQTVIHIKLVPGIKLSWLCKYHAGLSNEDGKLILDNAFRKYGDILDVNDLPKTSVLDMYDTIEFNEGEINPKIKIIRKLSIS